MIKISHCSKPANNKDFNFSYLYNLKKYLLFNDLLNHSFICVLQF